MSTAYAGTTGTVLSGSTDMDVTGFSADVEANEVDTTTTGDAGWEDAISSFKKVSGTFDFFYSTAKKPTGATAGLTPGATPTLTLAVGGGDTLSGKALITKVTIKSAVKEAISGTCAFRSKGAWTLPS